jgi:hypothetical protein
LTEPPAERSARVLEPWLPIAIALAATVLYLLTAPGVVNLDGLGYLKLLPHNFAAGHLLYMPLLRGATRLLGGHGVRVGRLLDALAAGTGVLLTFSIAWLIAPLRTDRRFVASVAAIGLALSYGYWIEACDVEAYALATTALLALVRVTLPYPSRPSFARALAMGACLGLAVLCHLSHVLMSGFVIYVCLDDPRGRKSGLVSAAIALVVGGLIALGAYCYAAFVVRGHDLIAGLRWVLTAGHGFRESPGPYAPAEAIYGLARSLVWSPYLYEADAPRLIGQLLLGLVPLVGVTALALRHRHALRGIPLGAGAAWVAPYAALALVFFGADPERWIFVLPALWIIAAVLIDALQARRLVAVLLLASLGFVNFVTAIGPMHRDDWPRHLAEVAAAPMADGDLAIFPGHAWDEYVAFYGHKTVEPFPVSYYAARDGIPQMWARLDREVAAAKARGGHVWALRFFDEAREVADDPAGYTELRTLGLSRAALRAALETRFEATPLPVKDGVSIVALHPIQ